jgi:hypothetical protein
VESRKQKACKKDPHTSEARLISFFFKIKTLFARKLCFALRKAVPLRPLYGQGERNGHFRAFFALSVKAGVTVSPPSEIDHEYN